MMVELPAPTVFSERERLSTNTGQFGSRTGMSVWGGFAFGGVFVAAGVAIFLLGLGVIEVEKPPRGDRAWMVTLFGAVFAMAGMMVWGMTWRGWAALAYRKRARRHMPMEPAMHDRPWDPGGETFDHWKTVRTSLMAAGFMTLFLAGFNYWAFFSDEGNWFVIAIVSIFDLILFFVWWQAMTAILRAFRFDPGRVGFMEFPYRPGHPLRLTWTPGSRLDDATQATMELRCLEEYWVTSGSGKNRRKTIVHERLWGERYNVPPRLLPRAHQPLELEFHPPADATPSRHLAEGEERSHAWQLVITIERPGVDLEEYFFIPVYTAD